jgi:transcription initiation factor TFIIIB Brf1 subunit/transcription initiation factor TFIIB
MDFINIEELQHNFISSKSTDFIKRFADKLDMDQKYINIAMEISNNINKLDLASTHEPPSVAAGCLLLVVNIYNLIISKKQISEVFGISDVTISKTYRRIYPYHKIITSNEITDMILERKQSMPKPKSNITKDNLILVKSNDTDTDSEVVVKEKKKKVIELDENGEKIKKKKGRKPKVNTISN